MLSTVLPTATRCPPLTMRLQESPTSIPDSAPVAVENASTIPPVM